MTAAFSDRRRHSRLTVYAKAIQHGRLSTQPFKTLTAMIGANPQLAFFTNTGLPTFFWIARFRSSARGDSTSALALSR